MTQLIMLIRFLSIIILGILLYVAHSSSMSTEEKIQVYSKFAQVSVIEDGTEEDTLCFQNTDLHTSLCPTDESISCGPIKGIMEFCESQVGTKDSTALKGCVNYVGYYILQEEHLACCPSSICDEWLNEMLESFNVEDLEGYEEEEGGEYSEYNDTDFIDLSDAIGEDEMLDANDEF